MSKNNKSTNYNNLNDNHRNWINNFTLEKSHKHTFTSAIENDADVVVVMRNNFYVENKNKVRLVNSFIVIMIIIN